MDLNDSQYLTDCSKKCGELDVDASNFVTLYGLP